MEKLNNFRIAWEKIQPESAVWCKTEEEAEIFTKAAKYVFPSLCSNWRPEQTMWEVYKDATCYTFAVNHIQGLLYGPHYFFEALGYIIMPFSELLAPEKIKEEKSDRDTPILIEPDKECTVKAFDGIDRVEMYYCAPCPICGRWLTVNQNHKFCEWCGQAIKFAKEDN